MGICVGIRLYAVEPFHTILYKPFFIGLDQFRLMLGSVNTT